MARIAALLIVIGGMLAAGPAAAQFGNVFTDPPPRPPGSVPNGGFPAQPPPVQYPGQNNQPQQYPGQAQPQYQPPPQASRPPSNIQAKPLAPPPGATSAPPGPTQASAPPSRNTPASANLPAAANPPQPADTSPPQSGDTVVTITPTQKVENGRAVFSGLDKITGRIISFDAAIGETVQFGALQVTARACYTRPPTEPTNTDVFVEVDEVTLQGEIKRVFTGWMFASSPGLHAVEHPIYDVWLTDCASPASGPVAQSAPPALAAGAPASGPIPASKKATAPRPAPPPPPPAAPAPLTDD